MTPFFSNRFVRNWLAAVVVFGSTAAVAASFGGFPSHPENGQALSASALNQNLDVVQQYLDQLDQRLVAVESATVSSMPPGTIVAFGGEAVPVGWLLCDGSELSRTANGALFAAIGVAHGGGDGVSTFNIPDLRGRFLRGVDHGAGIDPDAANRARPHDLSGNSGDAVGSIQDHLFAKHGHPLYHGNGTKDQVVNSWMIGNNGKYDPSEDTGAWMGGGTGSAGGNETRPVNAYVDYLIKY